MTSVYCLFCILTSVYRLCYIVSNKKYTYVLLFVERGDNMAISEAQKKAVAKYNAANYERIELRVEKGQKDIIKAHAESNGESLNGFINRAISETMEKENQTKE